MPVGATRQIVKVYCTRLLLLLAIPALAAIDVTVPTENRDAADVADEIRAILASRTVIP